MPVFTIYTLKETLGDTYSVRHAQVVLVVKHALNLEVRNAIKLGTSMTKH